MSDILERVARAISGQETGELDERWYRKARAGIAAMREPTAEMIGEGWKYTGDPCWEEDVERAWKAMIDAALN